MLNEIDTPSRSSNLNEMPAQLKNSESLHDEKEEAASPEERAQALQEAIEENYEDIAITKKFLDDTRDALTQVRNDFGLPPIQEDPPSIISGEERIRILEERRRALVDEQGKGNVVQAEKIDSIS